jgi:hypothetical protein
MVTALADTCNLIESRLEGLAGFISHPDRVLDFCLK